MLFNDLFKVIHTLDVCFVKKKKLLFTAINYYLLITYVKIIHFNLLCFLKEYICYFSF